MKRSILALSVGGLVALTACGSGEGTPSTAEPSGKPPPCRPSGRELQITIMDVTFDKECLAAPAGTAFAIRFDNEDSNTHNLAILGGGTSLFTGEIVIGPKVATYRVGALPAGTYTFRCDVHPTQMQGTFVVSG